MTLDWPPVPLFLCSRGAFVIYYFLKCYAQSAGALSFLIRGYYFLCSISIGAEGPGRLGERGEGGQPGLLEGLLVFLRDRGNGLHLWHTFVILFPLRSGNEYSQRFIINCERKISGDG